MKTYTGRTPRRILEWLRDQPEPASAREIADALPGSSYTSVVDALTALANGGAVERTGRRNRYRYALPKP